ncbi:MAG: ABC transporter ATP-binding protein [Myxococcota bacterium]
MPIRLENLEVTFRDPHGKAVPVLSIEEFEIEDGEQLCLVGGSGSGKTTLLNVLAGITQPTRGKVLFGKQDIAALGEAARDDFRASHIGYVFQSFNLLQSLSALENVALAGTFGGLSKKESVTRAEALLERVDLGHRQDAFPSTLSVGEQQRVGIARALINRPNVVLADEPTANLDEKRSDEVLALLEEIVAEEEATLVLVTHETRVRERFVDDESDAPQRVVDLAEISE